MNDGGITSIKAEVFTVNTDILSQYIDHQNKRFDVMMSYFSDLVDLNRKAFTFLNEIIPTDNDIHLISMNMYYRIRNLLMTSFMSLQRHEYIQSQLSLRNALEATVLAGYIHARGDEFDQLDIKDIVFDKDKKLANKARAWMEKYAKPYSDNIKRAKLDINKLFAHASIGSSFGTIREDANGEIVFNEFDRVGECEMMQALLTISYFSNSAASMYIFIRNKFVDIDENSVEYKNLHDMFMHGTRIQQNMVAKFPDIFSNNPHP